MPSYENGRERPWRTPLMADTGSAAPVPADWGPRGTRGGDVGPNEVASEAADQARATLGTAGDRSREVAQQAVDHAQDVAGTVRDEAANVAGEVTDRARALAGEASDQLETQTEEGIRRLAQGVDRLAAKAIALAEGRPREAAPLQDFIWQAAERLTVACDGLYDLADTLERRGWQGAASEVQSFAQRRPAAFLLGATIAGFGLGRGFRSSSEPEPSTDDPSARSDERNRAVTAGGARYGH